MINHLLIASNSIKYKNSIKSQIRPFKNFLIKFSLYLLILTMAMSNLYGKQETQLISIVVVKKATIRSKSGSDNRYIVNYYKKGKILKLDTCNSYGWCKIKDKQLYISSVALGIMEIQKDEKREDKIIEKLVKPTLKKSIKKKQKLSCIKLKQIDLTENEIFNKRDQTQQLLKYNNKCINAKLIKKIVNTISSYYLDKGFITTKPYLKEQVITDGQLDINIQEGKVENIINKDTNSSNWKIATAFVGQKNKLLNLRDLETSLEILNRVASANSSFKLKPGKNVGGSIVQIKTKKTLPIHLSLGTKGEGTIKDNNQNLTAILTIDNLLGINDILTFTYNGKRIQQEYQGSKGSELNYSFPIGSYIISLIRSNSSYRQGVDGINAKYLSNGNTIGEKISLKRVIYRNQTNKVKAELLLYHKATKNYFEHELIEVSSYKTTLAQLDLRHTSYQSFGQNTTVYSIYQGTDWFGALSDQELNGNTNSSNQAKLEFTKYSLNNSLYYYFKDRTYYIDSTFHLQYTKDNLFNNDKLTVGSDYTVRGYKTSNYNGNSAYYIKNNLNKTFTPNLQKDLLQSISIFIGVDGGYVKCENQAQERCGELYGNAIGFSTSSSRLSTFFMWSRPIKSLSKEFKKETLFSFNIDFKL